MFSTHVKFYPFVASYPRACALSPDSDGVSIHHTRLVQPHPGVQSLWGHRRPECDLGEQGPPRRMEEEKNIRTSLQLMHPGCELA